MTLQPNADTSLSHQLRNTRFASMSLMTAVLGTALGMLVGAIMHGTLTVEQLNDWGWRIPFLAGIVLCVPPKLEYVCVSVVCK